MKADNNPTSLRWDKESQESDLKGFLQKEANDDKRSLNYLINKILKDYKEGKLKYSGTTSN